MDLENTLAALEVRVVHHDLAVETAGTQQRRVENVGAVGGRDDDDVGAGFETVHLDQNLVQRLLALVMAAAQSSATLAADRVDFVDEDDRRRFGLGALEQVAYAARADADEHFDELGTGDAEERHAGLTSHGARHQGLAGTRRANHQHALGNTRAQTNELFRFLQELDDFSQFLLGFFRAGHVRERDLRALHVAGDAGAAAAKAHRLVLAATHRAHHPPQQPDDQQRRHDCDEELEQHAGGIVALALREDDVLPFGIGHAVAFEHVDEVRLGRLVAVALVARILQRNENVGAAANDDFRDVAALDLLRQLVVADLTTARHRVWRSENDDEQQQDNHRQNQPQTLGVAAGKRVIPVWRVGGSVIHEDFSATKQSACGTTPSALMIAVQTEQVNTTS